jgi:hypothetical protein
MKYFQGSRGLGTACLAFKGNLKEWKTDERYFESERYLNAWKRRILKARGAWM